MPIARFWTESGRALHDVGHLLWFRSAATRRRTASRWGLFIVVGMTTLAAVGPAFADTYRTDDNIREILALLPTALVAFLVLGIAAGVSSGGGRELLPRDQGVAFPVSPTTDHLGALLLTPFNVAWLVQTWTLLAGMSFAVGATGLAGAQAVVLLWILVATAVAQLVAWMAEAVRRGPAGTLVVRSAGLVTFAAGGWLYFTGRLASILDRLPTQRLVDGAVAAGEGDWLVWVTTVLVLLVVLPLLVALGGVAAHVVVRRHPRDELRIESETHRARPTSGSDLLALLRLDRASVWRVVPMRRGIVVLAVGPGLVGVAGDLDWPQMTILPGLVASGAALLFGVNAWCLEGRGVLWRESLPADPSTVFDARVIVLMELLLLSSGGTLVLASLRAGVPSGHELVAILCTWVVVTLQVVSASMRWSGRRPFAVDLRSARATPAPPGVMVGYSARLALSTTMTGLVFSVLARQSAGELAVLVALVFLAVSCRRVLIARAAWADPVQRVRIVSTVAG